jgi:hypothetical protein
MKPYFIFILSIIYLFTSCNRDVQKMIETPAPSRAAGQTDVLQLRADPIPIVRVAFI